MVGRTEDRLRALLELGWRPRIAPHEAGRLDALERDGHEGPWTITRTLVDDESGEVAGTYVTGWTIDVIPGPRLRVTGAASRRTGVYSTLDACLDEAERHIARDTLRRETRSGPR